MAVQSLTDDHHVNPYNLITGLTGFRHPYSHLSTPTGHASASPISRLVTTVMAQTHTTYRLPIDYEDLLGKALESEDSHEEPAETWNPASRQPTNDAAPDARNNSRKRKRNEKIQSRKRLRQEGARRMSLQRDKYLFNFPPANRYLHTHFGKPETISIDFSAQAFDSTKPGFISNNIKDKESAQKIFHLPELLERGFRLIPWVDR
jgi:hypothetical protein